jgi:hypothetical protein
MERGGLDASRGSSICGKRRFSLWCLYFCCENKYLRKLINYIVIYCNYIDRMCQTNNKYRLSTVGSLLRLHFATDSILAASCFVLLNLSNLSNWNTVVMLCCLIRWILSSVYLLIAGFYWWSMKSAAYAVVKFKQVPPILVLMSNMNCFLIAVAILLKIALHLPRIVVLMTK